MPVANAGTYGNTGGPMDWFNELPKLSRSFAGCLVFSAICISYGVPAISYALLDWQRVFRGLQVWRVLTHAAIGSKLSFPLLFELMTVLMYGSTLERSIYSHNPADYLFMHIFGALAMATISLVAGPLLKVAFIATSGQAMVMMIVYVWSREFPEQDVKLYGIVKIKGFWLPFALLGLEAVLGRGIFTYACGILIGHAWYFFTNLLPRGTGQTYLPTPRFVHTLAAKLGLQGTAAPAASAPAARQGAAGGAGGSTFRTFRGGGQRLGS